MSKGIEYQVVRVITQDISSALDELSDIIREWLLDGWQVTGGICVSPTAYHSASYIVMQSLVLVPSNDDTHDNQEQEVTP